MPTYAASSVTQDLLFHLAKTPGAVHRDTLAKAVGTSEDYAGRLLSGLVRRGRVARVGRGTYNLVADARRRSS
jgi:DNA-binding IclR family transcriptional regulator